MKSQGLGEKFILNFISKEDLINWIRIIPSLLLYNNTLVKGVKFSNYKNAGNPVTTVLGLPGPES